MAGRADLRHRAGQAKTTGASPSIRDFRELLARQDIDGVLIVTPDHWHACHAIAAAERRQGHLPRKAADLLDRRRPQARRGRPAEQPRPPDRLAAALVSLFPDRLRAGPQQPHRQARNDPRLRTRSTRAGQSRRRMPVPKYLDYDFWLGPTAEAPFTEDRVHPQVSYEPAGLAPDRALLPGHDHRLGLAHERHRPMGKRHGRHRPGRDRGQGPSSPTAASSMSTRPFTPKAVYANGVRLIHGDGRPGRRPLRGRQGLDLLHRGARSRPPIRPSSARRPARARSSSTVSTNHMKNFLECMRNRKDPIAPVEVGHRSNTSASSPTSP